MCGDFNIDLLKIDEHIKTKEYINILNSYGLFPTITKPSRVTKDTATLIDNIFTNIISNDNFSGLLVTDISDHFPVFNISKINGFTKQNISKMTMSRQYSDKNISRFKAKLQAVNWTSITNSLDVNNSYNNFTDIVNHLFAENFPLTKHKPRKESTIKPWLTPGLINACKKKNNLYRQFLKHRTDQSERKYKTYKNKLTNILRYSEKSTTMSLLQIVTMI